MERLVRYYPPSGSNCDLSQVDLWPVTEGYAATVGDLQQLLHGLPGVPDRFGLLVKKHVKSASTPVWSAESNPRAQLPQDTELQVRIIPGGGAGGVPGQHGGGSGTAGGGAGGGAGGAGGVPGQHGGGSGTAGGGGSSAGVAAGGASSVLQTAPPPVQPAATLGDPVSDVVYTAEFTLVDAPYWAFVVTSAALNKGLRGEMKVQSKWCIKFKLIYDNKEFLEQFVREEVMTQPPNELGGKVDPPTDIQVVPSDSPNDIREFKCSNPFGQRFVRLDLQAAYNTEAKLFTPSRLGRGSDREILSTASRSSHEEEE